MSKKDKHALSENIEQNNQNETPVQDGEFFGEKKRKFKEVR